jgi:hypothetical protein
MKEDNLMKSNLELLSTVSGKEYKTFDDVLIDYLKMIDSVEIKSRYSKLMIGCKS